MHLSVKQEMVGCDVGVKGRFQCVSAVHSAAHSKLCTEISFAVRSAECTVSNTTALELLDRHIQLEQTYPLLRAIDCFDTTHLPTHLIATRQAERHDVILLARLINDCGFDIASTLCSASSDSPKEQAEGSGAVRLSCIEAISRGSQPGCT